MADIDKSLGKNFLIEFRNLSKLINNLMMMRTTKAKRKWIEIFFFPGVSEEIFLERNDSNATWGR